MIEFYPNIKLVHIAMAMASVALFALRGAGVVAGMRWPHATVLRWASYAIDTTLLTAALMMLTFLPGAMFANGWLAAKVTLLVVYVLLGVFALRRGRTQATRVACYIAALATFAMMYTIARAHHPLGFLQGMVS